MRFFAPFGVRPIHRRFHPRARAQQVRRRVFSFSVALETFKRLSSRNDGNTIDGKDF